MTNLEAAIIYASWGWHVFPLMQGSKHPVKDSHGFKDATTDPVQIGKWWQDENPNYNIGIACGEVSGLVVFDIDPRNGGDNVWEEWTKEVGFDNSGAMQLTPSGGQHYIALYHPEFQSGKFPNKDHDGVDLLSDGKYMVAYPSIFEGRSYQWEGESDPFDGVAPMRIPENWVESYKSKRQSTESNKSIETELIKGSRNNGLTAYAGAMRRYGATEAEILAALAVANETRCDPPLPPQEIATIARSVARYEPDSDIAAYASLGEDAALAILEAAKEVTKDYFLTRATSYLSQPNPIKWIVKKYIPEAATVMIFGPSKHGKTFVSLDIACHISLGLPWQGSKTKEGVVVYLAGEGNYGIRQRVASWCKQHSISNLDNLLISNKAIAIDDPMAAAKIIHAVKELTNEEVKIVFVDTVNRHMAGDENHARDVSNFLNNTNIICSALGSTVVLVHHSGNGLDAQDRARGSSAWIASLDAQFSVTRKDEIINFHCKKMKDGPEPDDVYGSLQTVPLGWQDEDGEEIKGAVFMPQSAPTPAQEPKKKESKIQLDIKKFTNGWDNAQNEQRDGMPYLSRSALKDYLVTVEGMKESTVDQIIKPSASGKLISNLLDAQIIRAHEHGWVVIDGLAASIMNMGKSNA